MKYLAITLFTFFLFSANAQKTATITVENVNTEQAIQIIENAGVDLKYSFDKFDRTNKILITKFFSWTSIAITNRAKLKFEAKNNTVVITMIEREYKSSDGWTHAPTNLSKKNIKKYLGTFADKITEIAANNNLALAAVENSMLIKKFKPIIEKEGLIIKYIQATKNMEGPEFRLPNIVFELDITNTKSDTVILKNAGVDRGTGSFTEPKPEVRFRIYTATIAPGETAKLFLYIGRTEQVVFDELNFSFGLYYKEMAGINVKLTSYNVTIPLK
jgi:hypothetical protein